MLRERFALRACQRTYGMRMSVLPTGFCVWVLMFRFGIDDFEGTISRR